MPVPWCDLSHQGQVRGLGRPVQVVAACRHPRRPFSCPGPGTGCWPAVPITALAPVAGLLLDRLPTRPVLVTAAAAESAIALALVWATGLTATLVLATGFGVCAAVLQPGLGAMVPRLTGPARVTRANSYLQAATWGGFTIGPLLAGLLISASGSGLALAVDAALYALGTAGLAALRLAARTGTGTGAGSDPATGARLSLTTQMRAGLQFLRADVDAGMLVAIVGLMTATTNMAVVAEVVFAEQVLGAGPAGYSVLVAGWTTGMVIGTLTGGRLKPGWLMTAALAGTVLTGIGVVLAGAAAVLWQAVAAYGIGGLANGLETVATRSYLGRRAPEHVAGRVFALYSGVVFGGATGSLLYLARHRTAARMLAAAGAQDGDARGGRPGAVGPDVL
jgi:MFS family permease